MSQSFPHSLKHCICYLESVFFMFIINLFLHQSSPLNFNLFLCHSTYFCITQLQLISVPLSFNLFLCHSTSTYFCATQLISVDTSCGLRCLKTCVHWSSKSQFQQICNFHTYQSCQKHLGVFTTCRYVHSTSLSKSQDGNFIPSLSPPPSWIFFLLLFIIFFCSYFD